jgi:quaternary ammonium compound-resistance protein SugE
MPGCYLDPMHYWLILLFAAGTEILWALTLRALSKDVAVGMVAACLVLTALNLVLLTWAMRGLPASTAYAVWTGLGAVGLTLVGAIWLNEPATPARLACIALIIAGVIGLKLTSTA